jgi:hypothetical protein
VPRGLVFDADSVFEIEQLARSPQALGLLAKIEPFVKAGQQQAFDEVVAETRRRARSDERSDDPS